MKRAAFLALAGMAAAAWGAAAEWEHTGRMVDTGGKALTVVAKDLSAENKFVKSVTFNGKPLDKTIEHADLMAGGELVFEMAGK